jgi:hypothetical protein
MTNETLEQLVKSALLSSTARGYESHLKTAEKAYELGLADEKKAAAPPTAKLVEDLASQALAAERAEAEAESLRRALAEQEAGRLAAEKDRDLHRSLRAKAQEGYRKAVVELKSRQRTEPAPQAPALGLTPAAFLAKQRDVVQTYGVSQYFMQHIWAVFASVSHQEWDRLVAECEASEVCRARLAGTLTQLDEKARALDAANDKVAELEALVREYQK